MRTFIRFSLFSAMTCLGLAGCGGGGDLKEGMPEGIDMSKNQMDNRGVAAGPFSSEQMKAGAASGRAAKAAKSAAMPTGMPGNMPIPKR